MLYNANQLLERDAKRYVRSARSHRKNTMSCPSWLECYLVLAYKAGARAQIRKKITAVQYFPRSFIRKFIQENR